MPVPSLHAWQPPEKQIPDKVPSILEGGSVKPDAIHLRGSSGEAIYVPLQAYEDFEKFLKERVASSAPALPRNVLDSIVAVGRLKEGYVDIDWKARLQVTEGNLGVSRIPLGMSNQNLLEAPAYQKGVQSFLRLNPAGGYDWWLYAEGAKSYEIQFRTRMKVQVNGNLSTLRFSLVDAPCQISIDLPGNNQQIQASGNGIPVVETEVGTDVTKATIFGVGGNLTVSWKDAANTDSVDSIEVESSTKWDLAPDARAWSGTTRFLVRTFGRKRAKEFQIKLPPGMRWSPQKSPRWEDSVELTPRNPEKGAEGNKEEGEALRVRLTDESNEAPIELTVAWDWNRVPDKSGRFQLMGPICEGVQRHEGRVELNVPSGLNLGWNSSAEFTLLQQDRVNEPMPTTRYLFRFNDPHYRFLGLLAREESVVRILPRYVVHVEPSRVSLDGILEFAVDPSTLSDLRIHMGAWMLDRLELDGQLLDYTKTAEGDIQPRLQELTPTNPILSARPAAQGRSLKLSAHKLWTNKEDLSLQLELPRISNSQSNSAERLFDHGTGGILLSHSPNLQIDSGTPSAEGLISEPRIPSEYNDLFANASRWTGSYFRFQSESSLPTWKGHFKVLPGKITVRRSFELELDESRVRVGQLFRIHIENEAIRELRLIVPRELVEPSSPESSFVKVLLDGEPLDWSLVPDDSEEQRPPKLRGDRWATIALSTGELYGKYDLQIDTASVTPALGVGHIVDHRIPLAWPNWPLAAEQLLDGDCTLRTPSHIECELDSRFQFGHQESWSSERRIAIPKEEYEIPCRIRLLTTSGTPKVMIDRLWIQTSLNLQQQRDRFVLRFHTESESISLLMPASTSDQPFQTQFLLNGRRVQAVVSDRMYRIDLPEREESTNPYVLEVWTWQPRSERFLNTLSPTMPRVENSDRIYPFLWQVHLPQGESMVLATPNLCPEYRWSWSSFGLARKNAWKQKSLEDWVGTHHETEMEAMTADIVFSGVGDSVGLWIMTLPRFALWLPVGVIFLLGFACWNRFPICRSPVALVGVAVVLALLVPIATDLAMLLTQWVAFASLLGVVITVAKWAIDYRVQKRSVFSNRQISRSRTTGLESSGRSVSSPIAQGTESLSPPSGAEVR